MNALAWACEVVVGLELLALAGATVYLGRLRWRLRRLDGRKGYVEVGGIPMRKP